GGATNYYAQFPFVIFAVLQNRRDDDNSGYEMCRSRTRTGLAKSITDGSYLRIPCRRHNAGNGGYLGFPTISYSCWVSKSDTVCIRLRGHNLRLTCGPVQLSGGL